MSKHLFDGHEYNVKGDAETGLSLHNNYGTHIASAECFLEYWEFSLHAQPEHGIEACHLLSMHENEFDNPQAVAETLVGQYAAATS